MSGISTSTDGSGSAVALVSKISVSVPNGGSHLKPWPSGISSGAGPRSRLEDDRMKELIPKVVHAAELLSRNLGYVQDHGLARAV